MQYREIGTTGVKVSPIGLGLMRLPLESGEQGFTSSRGADREASIKLMRHAIDSGINYFDTAFNYLHGESEKIAGEALQDGYRDKVVLTTKSPIWMIKETDDFRRLLEKQLGRLQTDHVDFYLLHCVQHGDWEDRVLAPGVIHELQRAKDEGLVNHIGFSFHDNITLFKDVIDSAAWDVCQLQLNYLDHEFQGGFRAAEYANARGIGVIAMEPLRGGHLVNVPKDVRETFAAVNPDRSPAEWAFDYLWNRSDISLTLSGMSTIEQVDENIAYAEQASVGMLNEQENAVFEQAEKQFAAYPTIPCTGCNYCAGCPQGVTIPYNFQTYNQYILSGDLDRAKWEYSTTIPLNGAVASECIACGDCEDRCPQHIKISEWMPKVAELLEG